MIKPLEIGVCSWAIDRHDVVRGIDVAGRQLDLRAIQLGFFTGRAVKEADPEAIRRAADTAGVVPVGTFLAFEGEDYSSIERIGQTGGYADDREYRQRLSLTGDVARVTAAMGCDSMAVHIGTVAGDAGSANYKKLRDRVREAADAVWNHGVRLLVETGRESSETLRSFLESVGKPNVGVNFDPANFVVYGTDEPGDALCVLRERVEAVHLKDAVCSACPGVEYGRPAPLGTGDAAIPRVVNRLRATGYDGPLLIERGSEKVDVEGIRRAVGYLRSMLA